MYYCVDCKLYWEDEEGVCCPKCGDVSETHILSCSQCEKDFECDDLVLPICDECREKVYTNLEKTLEFAKWEAEEDKLSEQEVNDKNNINTFYTWFFGVDEINRILEQYAKKHANIDDIRNFWEESDESTVDDFLKKEFDL